jgi:hypothetical protein
MKLARWAHLLLVGRVHAAPSFGCCPRFADRLAIAIPEDGLGDWFAAGGIQTPAGLGRFDHRTDLRVRVRRARIADLAPTLE